MTKQQRAHLRFVHLRDQAEARVCAGWRQVVRADLVLLVALVCCVAFFFWVSWSVVSLVFVLVTLDHIWLSVRFTCRVRKSLGFWPWRG